MKKILAIKTSEKDFLAQIRDLSKLFGWAFYHPFLSKWSERGWPDVTLLRVQDKRLIFAELKTDRRKSKLTPDQARWLWALRKIPGVETKIWRPRHLERIAQLLR